MGNIIYSHSTGYPSRRVYKVISADKEAQDQAETFIEMFGAYYLTNTRGKIKFILI